MYNDAIIVLYWWAMLFGLGLIGLPISWLVFKKFIGAGYGFSRLITILVISYTMFLLSVTKLLPFTKTSLIVIITIYGLINLYVLTKNSSIIKDLKNSQVAILVQEILFASGLFFWSYIRGHHPDINGLEKLMDLGFVNSAVNTKFLPPTDMWFAGEPINYYWFGHYITALLTKLSSIPTVITYNLMIATIAGLAALGAFTIIATLAKKVKPKRGRAAIAAGIISAILLIFGGNFHTPIYSYIKGVDSYWYPDATRFIGYNPETDDKTIHEFPIYSFVVSDLHAHLLNLPIAILYLGLLINLVLDNKKSRIGNWKLEIGNWKLVPLGLVLGIMFITNAWDFGNYLLVTSAVLGLTTLLTKGLTKELLIRIVWTIIIGAIALFIAVPFLINFKSIAQGVQLVNARSPLWQLSVLWGFPAVLTIIFAVVLIKIRKNIKLPDLIILSFIAAGWTLVLLPEIIFLKDIYIASHHRANTMFKLTYQAYVLFYLSSGYIFFRLITSTKTKVAKLLTSVVTVILLATILYYPTVAINSFYGELKTYKGLAGDSWFREKYPEQYTIADWLIKNARSNSVLLEAPGDSYTEYNVVSAYTGLPTVSGWFVHEWLWRGSSEIPAARTADIETIYTNSDPTLTSTLLQKYSVDYVLVTSQEREKYPDINEEKFSAIGQPIFTTGSSTVYLVSTP